MRAGSIRKVINVIVKYRPAIARDHVFDTPAAFCQVYQASMIKAKMKPMCPFGQRWNMNRLKGRFTL